MGLFYMPCKKKMSTDRRAYGKVKLMNVRKIPKLKNDKYQSPHGSRLRHFTGQANVKFTPLDIENLLNVETYLLHGLKIGCFYGKFSY